MATSGVGGEQQRTGPQPDDVDLPEEREYTTDEYEEIDAALVEALEAAEAADHDYLSHLLRCEIKSLYLEDQLGV